MQKGNPKIGIRFRPHELAHLKMLAEVAGVPLSTLIRRACRPLLQSAAEPEQKREVA